MVVVLVSVSIGVGIGGVGVADRRLLLPSGELAAVDVAIVVMIQDWETMVQMISNKDVK